MAGAPHDGIDKYIMSGLSNIYDMALHTYNSSMGKYLFQNDLKI